jgi:hypothetical protein
MACPALDPARIWQVGLMTVDRQAGALGNICETPEQLRSRGTDRGVTN